MPSIYIPPDPPDKVFGLSMPDDMLMKLDWEIAGLRRALFEPIETGAKPAYHAFNCAVTAWHMTDWVWQSATVEDRAFLLSKLAVPATGKSQTDFNAFTRAVMKRHRALHICRQIAIGSKHKIVERSPDPDVGAKEHRHEGGPSSLLIRDGEVWRPALEVFEEAAQAWVRLLREWGYFEAELLGMETR
jgi:hypothetical protein